jgi:hypothetical protein
MPFNLPNLCSCQSLGSSSVLSSFLLAPFSLQLTHVSSLPASFLFSNFLLFPTQPMPIRSDASQGLDRLDGDDSDSASNASSSGNHGQQSYLWSNYSIPQLRELLRQRGQLTTGSKSVMKKRLKTLDRANNSALSSPVNQTAAPAATTATIATTNRIPASVPKAPTMAATTLDVRVPAGADSDYETPKKTGTDEERRGRSVKVTHPLRSRGPTRSNSFSAHFAGNEWTGP